MKTKEMKVGAITYKSIKSVVESAQKSMIKRGLEPIAYMTLYQRISKGMSPSQAMAKPVRVYKKKSVEVLNEHELVENLEVA